MNSENPFRPPTAEQVVASEKIPKHNIAVIIAMYFLILITWAINAAIARAVLEIVGIPAMAITVLFGREILAVYLIIASLALFRCKVKTYAITSAVLIAVLFARAYVDCVIDGSMDGLLNYWIGLSVVAMATSYLYVAESFLVRRIRSPERV